MIVLDFSDMVACYNFKCHFNCLVCVNLKFPLISAQNISKNQSVPDNHVTIFCRLLFWGLTATCVSQEGTTYVYIRTHYWMPDCPIVEMSVLIVGFLLFPSVLVASFVDSLQ